MPPPLRPCRDLRPDRPWCGEAHDCRGAGSTSSTTPSSEPVRSYAARCRVAPVRAQHPLDAPRHPLMVAVGLQPPRDQVDQARQDLAGRSQVVGDRVEQVVGQPIAGRPPPRRPQLFGPPDREALGPAVGRGLHQGPDQGGEQADVLGVGDGVEDADLERGLALGQARVEVEHPGIASRAAGDHPLTRAAIAGQRPERARWDRRWARWTTAGSATTRSRCRGPRCRESWR